MKRFVLHVLTFLVLQSVVAAVVWWACPHDQDHYAAATGDKRRHLAACPSPRIIFVGGSSVAFGFDSRVAAQAGLHPVNMGHNRSLGLRFMLAQVRGALRRGDVVVVSPEYSLLWKPGVDETLITHLEYDLPSLANLDARTGRRLIDEGLPWAASKVRCAAHQVSTHAPIEYTRRAFDASGDFARHRGTPARPHTFTPVPWPAPQAARLDESLTLLAEFGQACEAAGARCVYAFAPLRRGQYESNAATVERVARVVRARSGLQIVIPLHEAIYEHDAYYDAGPHLMPSAATARTRALLDAL